MLLQGVAVGAGIDGPAMEFKITAATVAIHQHQLLLLAARRVPGVGNHQGVAVADRPLHLDQVALQ